MDSNSLKTYKRHRVQGFTLLDMLIAIGVMYIVMLGLVSGATHTYEAVKMQQIRSYLLQVQAIQSRNWLNSGTYRSLSALPLPDIDGVRIAENKDVEAGFALKLTIDFMSKEAPCRTVSITEEGIIPKSCLF